MENVLVAIVIVFLVLFAALTLGNAVFSTQEMLDMTRAETESRLQEQSRTQLALIGVQTHAGTQAEITLKNTGSVKLADFDQWDVILQYFDDAAPAGYHIDWLPYTATLSTSNQWTVQGIYSDVALDAPEVYEPHIFDPGEEAIFDVRLSPPIGAGTYVQLVITAPNGATASTVFRRNVPPVLTTNIAIVVNSEESITIDKTYLETTDVDDKPLDLIYAVTVPVTAGTLAPDTLFTQADIDNNLLQYTNTSGTEDSFQMTIGDGEDSIGPYTFNITVNMPPTVDVNTGMVVAHGTSGAIGNLLLKATDPDNTDAELIYTITTPPTHGSLSKTTFSQEDIVNGNVSYQDTNTDPGSDSFAFTVSDGHKVIGPITFAITAT